MHKLCSDVRRKVKDENARSPSLSLYLFLAQSADRKHQTWLLRHLATCLEGLEGQQNITQLLIKCEHHLERGTKGHRSSISESKGYFTIHCLVTSLINQWTQNVPLLVLQTCFGTCRCYNVDLSALSAVVAYTANRDLLKGQVLWWDHVKNEREQSSGVVVCCSAWHNKVRFTVGGQ